MTNIEFDTKFYVITCMLINQCKIFMIISLQCHAYPLVNVEFNTDLLIKSNNLYEQLCNEDCQA